MVQSETAMESCLFCRIAKKELPSKIAYEDDRVFAFHDIKPQAPVHVLICPRKHIATLNDVSEEDASVLTPPIVDRMGMREIDRRPGRR